ncbi:nucleotide exchange factor GrpE [Flavonifractor plautii]|uniref:nucleotide exchange factor GrpE n=1 Tax=Flavonifractor plautii TaxID=292800 RepID=UPI0019572F9B|nr:nucleotide exchange factor GrpE [Flavonifractor plautii]MBM6663839.1 nucleotide exchange factor GrpE [Flavonifractor plautii]
MSKKEKQPEEVIPEEQTAQAAEAAEENPNPLLEELETLKQNLTDQEDKFLRLAAEYDNYRRRSQKEKESAWADSKAETAAAFLPVYDNLERALKQETADEAYKKGVEMTMTQLKEVLSKLGIQEIPALGEAFDPNLHNAVMHVEDENAGENTIVEVFQAGFRTEEKVIRFSMVKVAN